MKPKKIVLQSIDSPRRDFEWRLFVANKLSLEGFSSIIGSKPKIRKIHQNSRYCIFLGRLNSNTSRSSADKKYIKEMQDNKTALFFIHDEGGFYLKGEYEEAVKRIYPEEYFSLDILKRVFFWGHAQEKIFNKSDFSSKFVISGSPRFDMYSSELLNILYDRKTKYSDNDGYVLICSRFAAANMVDDDPGALSKRAYSIRIEGGMLESNRDSILESMFESWSKVSYELSYFVPAIAKLAINFPLVNFILRPHPAERESFYKEAFSHFKNIKVSKDGDVRPLVMSAKAIIHSECTTGVEATIAGKPNINFRPAMHVRGFERYQVAGLSDDGILASNYEELSSALQAVLEGSWEVESESLARDYLYNLNGKALSADVIVDEIKGFSKNECDNFSSVNAHPNFSRKSLVDSLEGKARKLLRYLRRDKINIKESKGFKFSDGYIMDLWCQLGGHPDCIKIENGVVYTYPDKSRNS